MKISVIRFPLPILVGIVLIGASCSSERTAPEVDAIQTSASADFKIAEMVIEGMTCEMSCAGRMYLKLTELDGVGDVDIRFANVEGNDNHDRAVVQFDPQKITEDDLVTAVNAVGGGVYFVKSTTVKHHRSADSGQKSEHRSSAPSEVSYTPPGLHYELPNFFEVFARLF